MSKIRKGEIGPQEGWDGFRVSLEDYVLALVDRLRRADFPIHPRSDGCARKCDYRNVCRLVQVRIAGKIWVEAPQLELEPSE